MKHIPLYFLFGMLMLCIAVGCKREQSLDPLNKSLKSAVGDSTLPHDTIPHDTIPHDTVIVNPHDTIKWPPHDTIIYPPHDTVILPPVDTIIPPRDTVRPDTPRRGDLLQII